MYTHVGCGTLDSQQHHLDTMAYLRQLLDRFLFWFKGDLPYLPEYDTSRPEFRKRYPAGAWLVDARGDIHLAVLASNPETGRIRAIREGLTTYWAPAPLRLLPKADTRATLRWINRLYGYDVV